MDCQQTQVSTSIQIWSFSLQHVHLTAACVFLVLVLLLPERDTPSALELSDVLNCTNCWYGCDNSSGNCSGQCAHGYFGPRCDQVCSQCLDCDKDSGYCISCHNRHYGQSCEFKCNENCMVGCRITGECYKCNEGFYDRTCNLTCPSPNCRNGCERHTGNCTGWGCNAGFWGPLCEKKCPENCGFTSCHQVDGTCQTCKDGYSGKTCGQKCNDEHCSLCQFDVTTCFNCYHGWWGDHCDKKCTEHCSHPYCSQHTGKCGKCNPGYYGPYCEGTCKAMCETCSDNTTCDTCKVGFYGFDCTQKCPDQCESCTRDGTCLQCAAGHFGEECMCEVSQCEQISKGTCSQCKNEKTWYPYMMGCCPCSDYCNSYNDGPSCNRTGCTHGCKDDYFGAHCMTSCSDHCVDRRNDTCDNETGECFHGCKQGWHLPHCNINCSLYFPHCKLCKEYLDNKNRHYVVCETCKSGYYKELYSGLCRPCENCDGGFCDGTIGSCNWGCNDGWYAKGKRYLCEYPCPDRCAENQCEKIGGKCKNGCQAGYYGPHCQHTCPINCFNKTCDLTSAKCLLGCISGYRGAYCNDSCSVWCGNKGCSQDDGYCRGCIQGNYGTMCSEKCSFNCVGVLCNQTGFCTDGCVAGWTGLFCEVSHQSMSYAPPTAATTRIISPLATIVLGSLLGIAAVLITILSVIIWKARRTGLGELGVEMTGK